VNQGHPNDTNGSSKTAAGLRWKRKVAAAAAALLVTSLAVLGWRWQRAQFDRTDGLRLAQDGKAADAEPLLLAALARDGDDVEILAALARLKRKGPDPASALPLLTRWCELRSADAEPFRLRMDLRHRIARGRWSAADRLRDTEQAAADGRRVLELEPTDDAVRREVVWLLLQVGRYEEAERECRVCLRRAPEDGWLHYLLARSLHGQSRRAEAGQALDPVVRSQPRFADALLLRARLYAEADRPELAIPLLRQALALDTCPRRECLYQLGLALAATGERDEADRVMAEVNLLTLKGSMTADAAPETESMRVQIAEAMLGMGRLAEAKEQLDRVLAESPDFAPAHRVLALYFDRSGKPDEAAHHRRLAGRKDRP
jgi:tetratricopeptide (TPR) repeat protein